MIRKAAPEDFDAVHKLISDLEECEFPESEFRQVYEEILYSKYHCILLYENESEVIGLLHLRLENQLHHCGKAAEIMELVVLEGHRSEGIGCKLFGAAFEYAKEQKCVVFEVTSNFKRTGAHRFYKRNGLEHTHYKFTRNIKPEENGLD